MSSMERSKPSHGSRGQKKGSSHAGSEFFALGTKANRDDSKSKISTMERKREASSSIASVIKKPKLSSSVRYLGESASGSISCELWEQMANECDPVDLVDTVLAAMDQRDNETVVRLLCGAIKLLITSSSRLKHDLLLQFALLYLSKVYPTIFCNEVVTSALLSILRRDPNNKSRQTTQAQILAANLLTTGYNDMQQWPEVFLRTFVDDAINERIWADNILCAPFIDNICHAFETRTPLSSLLLAEGGSSVATANQPNREASVLVDDEFSDNSTHGPDGGSVTGLGESQRYDAICVSKNRFFESEHIVEKYIADAIKEQLNKRQQQDCYTRNFLKFLCTVSGIPEVRCLCISRLELWIHNGKLVKFAQQLLSYICFNLKSNSSKDFEVLAMLVKMRLKTKPLINFYMICIKEMIILQPDILRIVLKLVVQNELSNSRNPNNMGMLATMFQTFPDQSASHLAEIYKEYLLQRDDCLRTLRVFLRELVRMLRFDINIVKFCKVFLNEGPDLSAQIEQLEYKDRIFHSMVDLTCLCMLLSVSPQVREASMSLRTGRDINSNSVLLKFYSQMAQLQLEAVSWMYETVPNLFRLQNVDYNQALHKILLLENPEHYSRCDQWPSEPERATLLRMVSETPVKEEALLRLILIGITKDIPFTIPETIDIIMLVIKRASAMRVLNCPAVQANKLDIIDFLFSMAEYHHPDNIKLPLDYDPPKLAITVLYWKAWLIMLMISAHNPSNFGAFCWDHYPTMKMLIEMCITNQFNENLMSKNELQIVPIERDHILEFETYLAAQTSQAVITEDNAILIAQLMLMDPMGPARKIPAVVLEQLKYLNKTLKLGHLLCRSRKPDLLLDIIQRQGTTQSMPWLSDLVQSSEGDFSHLPVQCLCEFLLFNGSHINEENSRDAKLVDFLRNLIMEPDTNKQTVCEVVDYIFRRLSSTVNQSRVAALRGIKIIFKCFSSDKNEWLLELLPQIPHFKDCQAFIIPVLRTACQVENSPDLVMSYIQFIAAHTLDDPVTEMLDHVIDMAQLIVERSTMFQHITPATEAAPETSESSEDDQENRLQTLKCLFVMFNNYIIKLREHHEPYEWTEYPDLLMVQFHDGIELPLHLNIIHAFIILLTRSNDSMPESIPILDYWFPIGRAGPTGFLPNSSRQEVQLFPDWLKLKMIRSPVERLVDAALHELTSEQIVLFVQNFGTPVNSMSKLLALLDHAVIEQFETVKNAILNKDYLAQLIEVQQARGAKNGHFTVQALELRAHAQTVTDIPKFSCEVLESIHLTSFQPQPPSKPLLSKSIRETEEILQSVLQSPQLAPVNNFRYRRLLHQLLRSEVASNQTDEKANMAYLMRLLERVKPSIKAPNTLKTRHSCTFFRVLLKHNLIKEEDWSLILLQKSEKTRTNEFLSVPQSKIFKNSITKEKGKPRVLPQEEMGEEEALQELILHSSWGKAIIKTESSNDVINYFCGDGMLVDWLSKADPEFTIVNRNPKGNLLFSKTGSDFRFYLLSLICHQTNWKTLIFTLRFLLSQPENDFNSSTVLNFIEALINNPKLWQGRDTNVSKAEQPEITISLTESELNVFADFLLNEGQEEMCVDPSKYDFKLCSRIHLFFKVTNKRGDDLITFVDNILKNPCPLALKRKVLQQVYLFYPSIKFIKNNCVGEHTAKLQTSRGCKADKVSNYLITCMGNLSLKKDFEALSSDTELLLRKLAASHSALFLRQLGVLTTLIQGRAQINLRTMRDEYHLHRFIQILRTLELMQEMLFDDAYKNEFQAALECYFTFFKHHSYAKEAYHILIKFVELLQAYINANPKSALVFVEQHVGILMDLAAKFHSCANLHQLVQGIALLQHKTAPCTEINEVEIRQEFDVEDQVEQRAIASVVAAPDVEGSEMGSIVVPINADINSRGTVSFAMAAPSSKSATISPHFLNLIKVVKHSSSEEAILGPLKEIESLTSKRFLFLNELFDRLLELIFSPSAQIRSNAFILLIRHLKHNPGRMDINRCTLNAYIQCLRCDNSSVASTAVDNLVEMTLLLQEHALEIVSIAFSLGIRSRLNTSTQIKRVLQTILLQYGH